MATALTTIFGTEIKVAAQPRKPHRQYVGLPGVHGLISMHLGSRGRHITITGKLAASGESYSSARLALQTAIDAIEAYNWAAAADYSYQGTTYSNVVFEEFKLVPDSDGKVFHWTSSSYATADFVAVLVELV